MAIQAKKNVKPTLGVAADKKLIVIGSLGIIHLKEINYKINTLGTKFISVPPYGAVYAGIDDLKPGLYSVIQFESENKFLGLNELTTDERCQFLSDKIVAYPGLTVSIIQEMFGL